MPSTLPCPIMDIMDLCYLIDYESKYKITNLFIYFKNKIAYFIL